MYGEYMKSRQGMEYFLLARSPIVFRKKFSMPSLISFCFFKTFPLESKKSFAYKLSTNARWRLGASLLVFNMHCLLLRAPSGSEALPRSVLQQSYRNPTFYKVRMCNFKARTWITTKSYCFCLCVIKFH